MSNFKYVKPIQVLYKHKLKLHLSTVNNARCTDVPNFIKIYQI